jgi:hypothetical protein
MLTQLHPSIKWRLQQMLRCVQRISLVSFKTPK